MNKVFASSASPLPGDPTEAPCTACEDETDEAIEYEYTYDDYEQDVADGQLMDPEYWT